MEMKDSLSCAVGPESQSIGRNDCLIGKHHCCQCASSSAVSGPPIVVSSLFDQALAHLLVVIPDFKGEKGVETDVGDPFSMTETQKI